MLFKTVLCWAGTEKLTWGSVFRWKSFDCDPHCPPPPPLCTWRLYPSTSTVCDVVWQRFSLTKETILSGCLSVCPIFVRPSVSSSCLLLQTKCAGINPLQEPGRLQSSQSPVWSCPSIHVLYINKSFSRPKRRRWQSKQGGSCCNQRCLFLVFPKSLLAV